MMSRFSLPGLTIALGTALGASTALAQPQTMRATTTVAQPQTPPGNVGFAVPHTLNDALAIAYSTNPTLLTSRATLRATDENVPQALAGWRPTVVLSGSAGYTGGVDRTFIPGGSINTNANRDTLSLSATVTQPLYRGGRTIATLNRSENQVLGQRARLMATEETVFANVVTSYVNVIQDQQLVALNVSNVQVLSQQLQATNDRFRVGEITQTDVAQAQAALSAAQGQLATAEGNLQTARASFQQFVGVLPGQLAAPQPLKPPVNSGAQVVQFSANNNPNVIAAMFDEAAGKDAVDQAFSALMPTVSLQGSESRIDNNLTPGTRVTGTAGLVSVSVPIYQGGAEYAAVRQAKQTEQSLRKTVDDQRRQAMQLGAQSWETLIAARATIASTQAAIRANQVALEGTEREALLGTRTTLDVLNAQQLLLNSQQTLVQNLASLVTASYSVAAAMGRLTAHDLSLPVAYYDETAYYNAVRNKLFGTGDHATDQPGR
jgi:outer membrane protein